MLAKLAALLNLAEVHRAYFYRLALTIGLLLVAAGRITDGTLSTAMTLIGAVLGLSGSGLAAGNTTTRKRDQRGAVDMGFIIGILFAIFLVLAILIELGHHPRIG